MSVEYVSRSSADQRAGRAGRVRPGHCYRLYSREKYEAFHSHTEPDIMRVHLGQALLQLLTFDVLSPFDFDFVERPPEGALRAALETLVDLGAVDALTNTFTPDGRVMADLAFDPRLSKMILEAERANVAYEGIAQLLLQCS